MVGSALVLVASAGGVGRGVLDQLRAWDVPVRGLVRRDDGRADELRGLGAEVVVGDLTRPETVAAALEGVGRMYFGMSVSPDHLLAATVVATVAREHAKLEVLVDMSQMTVSQMTATSTAESHHQRLHWLAEQVFDWSGLPMVHVRPTTFLDNPLFLPRWRRGRSGTTTPSRCPSARGAPRRSPRPTSCGWSPPCCATQLCMSDTSTS
jgi:uncharacterized protein YbjT (DUF2867 family)